MDTKYTIITPTGGRPESFKLCYRYILRQTIQPINWIVIDDFSPPTTMPDISFLTYVRRTKKSTDPQHTITVNMLEGINHIKTDKVVIFEDDDYYSPEYAESLITLLDKYDIVGERPTIHYNIQNSQYKIYDTSRLKTCLCKTAFNSKILPIFKECCEDVNRCCIDINLWKFAIKRGFKGFIARPSKVQHIGFKGVPGRSGAMGMHCKALNPNPSFTKDIGYKKLREWLGENISEYFKLYNINPNRG